MAELGLAPGGRTVLLAHKLPDGQSHVDWLLERHPAGTGAGDDDRDLLAFRLTQQLDLLPAGSRTTAQRLDDHRRRYLQYEGPVSGNRGTVSRLAAGTIRACGIEEAAVALNVTIAWSTGITQSLGLSVDSDGQAPPNARWKVHCLSRQSVAE